MPEPTAALSAGDMHFPTLAVCANCGGGRCRFALAETCNELVGVPVGPGHIRCSKPAAWIVRATSGLQEPRCDHHGTAYSGDRRVPANADTEAAGGAR